jgi:uncharacterized protein (TIGR03067 family)
VAPSKPDPELIQGAWKIESMEVGSKRQPAERVKGVYLVFKGNTMSFKEQHRSESISFKLHPSNAPKALDLGEPDDPFNLTHGIYELNGDQLKICMDRVRDGARPTAFESKPGSQTMLVVLTREKNPPALHEEKAIGADEFPKAVIGKWTFSKGETAFGVFARDTEFTQDGRVLQLDRDKNQWVENYKYRFERDELVLVLPKKDAAGLSEIRVRVGRITDEALVATSPSGTLRRVKK